MTTAQPTNDAPLPTPPPFARDTSKNSPWYDASPPNLSPETRSLLEHYSGIPPADVISHVAAIRDKAWSIFPYPCIGGWRFLDSSLADAPQYSAILARVKAGERFLDVGCCFGQMLRRLVADGAPSQNLFGTDIEGGFFELGFEMFGDRHTLRATWFVADFLADEGAAGELVTLQRDGNISIIHAASFLHLFDLPTQKRIATRMLRMLPRATDGVKPLVCGRQMGKRVAGIRPDREREVWMHSAESFKDMWEDVAKDVDCKVEVWTEYEEVMIKQMQRERQQGLLPSDSIRIRFAVSKV